MTVPNQRTSPEGLNYLFAEMSHLWSRLDPDTREYINLYHRRSRKLNKLATDAWNRRSDRLQYLLAYCKANKYTEHGTREKILHDWVFNDANDDWLRYSREVQRCQAAIDMELKMTSLLAAVPVA